MRKLIIIAALVLLPNLALAKNLYIPWTSQAPMGNWSEPWQNACEETSLVMLDYYYKNDRNLTKEIATQAISKKLADKNMSLGKSLDENSDTIIKLVDYFSDWHAYAVENPTVADIKNELESGRPVIGLFYAPALNNNQYHYPVAVYHVLVIKGYDDNTNEFITNDPGTSSGLDYRYSYTTILNALHDYLPDKQTASGKKIAIFTSAPNPYFTAQTLIKTKDNPAVYLVIGNVKRHIINETVFLANGWHWQDIKLVSEGLLAGVPNGKIIINIE